MAVVAVDAVVDIAIHLRVVKGVRIVPAMFMTSCARELRVVARKQVARRALAIRIAMVDGERCVVRVSEPRCGDPTACAVTILTGCCEDTGIRRRGMRRVAAVVVVGLMASKASGGQCRVIAVRMTVAAVRWRHFVRTGKRECGVVVVKG
jgi:hypothetical protein